jgi:hypothetical protein
MALGLDRCEATSRKKSGVEGSEPSPEKRQGVDEGKTRVTWLIKIVSILEGCDILRSI